MAWADGVAANQVHRAAAGEAVTWSDTAAALCVLQVWPGDVVEVGDIDLSPFASLNYPFGENVSSTLVDECLARMPILASASDILSLADIAAYSFGEEVTPLNYSFADAVSLSDTASARAVLRASMGDLFQLIEADLSLFGIAQYEIADDLSTSFSDVASALLRIRASASDTAVFADVADYYLYEVGAAFPLPYSFSDSIIPTDAVLGRMPHRAAVSEAWSSFNDLVAALGRSSFSAGDSIAWQDVVSGIAGVAAQPSDSTLPGDAAVAITSLIAQPADDAYGSDAIGGLFNFYANPADDVSSAILDSVNRGGFAALMYLFGETLSFSDSLAGGASVLWVMYGLRTRSLDATYSTISLDAVYTTRESE